LDDAFDKLRRAKEHFESLRVEVEAFEQRDTHTIRYELEPQAGKYTFRIYDVEEPPSHDWGLIVGDCVHNARTALDYLMVRLLSLVTDTDPLFIEHVTFPIYDNPKSFPGRGAAEACKDPRFSGYLARIEELQPFNRANPSVWGSRPDTDGPVVMLYPLPVMHSLPLALKRLAKLDTIDKHRIVNTIWTGVRSQIARALSPPKRFTIKDSHSLLGALENGAEVGSMTFATPLPGEWHPDEMDMKQRFPVQVSMNDEDRFARRVLEVVPFCLWGVESVLTIFQPVFDSSQPPLPVTAIPNIPEPGH
jgi:hypothetical protein